MITLVMIIRKPTNRNMIIVTIMMQPITITLTMTTIVITNILITITLILQKVTLIIIREFTKGGLVKGGLAIYVLLLYYYC